MPQADLTAEHHPHTRMLRWLLVAVVAPLLLGLGACPASADAVPRPPEGPYIGPFLDWTKDSARQYSDRFGTDPSLFEQTVRYPLNEDDGTYLRQFVDQAAQQGALAVVTLEPVKPLDDLTTADAGGLADQLSSLHRRTGVTFLVGFAPEMNGSWTPWGQQPAAYRDAFRTVAEAVHAGAPSADMLWSPSYGAGYPFGTAYGATEGSGPRIDVDSGDDPYAPYWPGADAVDWVGLSLYHYGRAQDFGSNQVPLDGEYADRLGESYGYSSADDAPEPFYQTYADGYDKPMAVRTGALYNPDDVGASELQIKQAWWRQVFDRSLRLQYPRIAAISWLERERAEDEVGGDIVDWRATHRPELAQAFSQDARAAGLSLDPVTRVLDQQTGNEATAQYRDNGPDIGDHMGWIIGCAVLALVLYLLSGVAGRFVGSWRYPKEHDPRDERLDFLRGWTIVAVVITHIELSGPYSYVTLNAIGGITGAEMFVLLSGLVLGMVYPVGVARLGEWAAAVGAWRRARKQYLTALGVVLLVYLIGLLPLISTKDVTTFTDRGTGANGASAAGQVYDLYANVGRLLDYPPPWYAVKALLLLEMGPWVFNIMGLFVVLSLLVPVLMWLIRRRLWWLVLAVSWALYLFNARHDVRLLPSQFEDVFPLLSWQIAFTHGLVIGYYRAPITRALTSRIGKVLVTLLMLAYVGALVAVWAGHTFDVAVPLVDGDRYVWMYQNLFQRTDLQPGRLIDLLLVLVTAFALLTTCWKPLNAAFGWFYVPLGKVSLYVFIVHVFFVVAVANIPGLDRTSIWQGLVIHTAVLAVIWLMVKKKFLFRLIPT